MTTVLPTRAASSITSSITRAYGLMNGQISKWFNTRVERDAYARSRRNLSKWQRIDPPETR